MCLSRISGVAALATMQGPNRTRAHVFRVGGAAATQCTQSAQHVTAPIRHREQPTAPPARHWPHPRPSFLLLCRAQSGYSLSCLTSLADTRVQQHSPLTCVCLAAEMNERLRAVNSKVSARRSDRQLQVTVPHITDTEARQLGSRELALITC